MVCFAKEQTQELRARTKRDSVVVSLFGKVLEIEQLLLAKYSTTELHPQPFKILV